MLAGLWPIDWSPEYERMSETIPWPENKETGYTRIRRKDIPSYINNDLSLAVAAYNRTKQYGWPQGRGYLAEPRAFFELIQLFDAEKCCHADYKNKGLMDANNR